MHDVQFDIRLFSLCKNCSAHLISAKYAFFYKSLLAAQRLKLLHRHKLANDVILLREPLLPPLQRVHLLGAQISQRVQRPIQILRQHVLVEAAARQATTGIPARKVLVGPAGAVKVAAARDVEDDAADGHVDGAVVGAVEGQEGVRVVGLEDDGGRLSGELRGRGFGEEGCVGCVEDDGDEEDVEGRDEAGAGEAKNVS